MGSAYWYLERYGEAEQELARSIDIKESLRKGATGDIRRDYLASQIDTYEWLTSTHVRAGAFREGPLGRGLVARQVPYGSTAERRQRDQVERSDGADEGLLATARQRSSGRLFRQRGLEPAAPLRGDDGRRDRHRDRHHQDAGSPRTSRLGPMRRASRAIAMRSPTPSWPIETSSPASNRPTTPSATGKHGSSSMCSWVTIAHSPAVLISSSFRTAASLSCPSKRCGPRRAT